MATRLQKVMWFSSLACLALVVALWIILSTFGNKHRPVAAATDGKTQVLPTGESAESILATLPGKTRSIIADRLTHPIPFLAPAWVDQGLQAKAEILAVYRNPGSSDAIRKALNEAGVKSTGPDWPAKYEAQVLNGIRAIINSKAPTGDVRGPMLWSMRSLALSDLGTSPSELVRLVPPTQTHEATMTEQKTLLFELTRGLLKPEELPDRQQMLLVDGYDPKDFALDAIKKSVREELLREWDKARGNANGSSVRQYQAREDFARMGLTPPADSEGSSDAELVESIESAKAVADLASVSLGLNTRIHGASVVQALEKLATETHDPALAREAVQMLVGLRTPASSAAILRLAASTDGEAQRAAVSAMAAMYLSAKEGPALDVVLKTYSGAATNEGKRAIVTYLGTGLRPGGLARADLEAAVRWLTTVAENKAEPAVARIAAAKALAFPSTRDIDVASLLQCAEAETDPAVAGPLLATVGAQAPLLAPTLVPRVIEAAEKKGLVNELILGLSSSGEINSATIEAFSRLKDRATTDEARMRLASFVKGSKDRAAFMYGVNVFQADTIVQSLSEIEPYLKEKKSLTAAERADLKKSLAGLKEMANDLLQQSKGKAGEQFATDDLRKAYLADHQRSLQADIDRINTMQKLVETLPTSP